MINIWVYKIKRVFCINIMYTNKYITRTFKRYVTFPREERGGGKQSVTAPSLLY